VAGDDRDEITLAIVLMIGFGLFVGLELLFAWVS